MKYTILINQKAAFDANLDLDFVDLAIFDVLKSFALVDSCKKKFEGDKVYFLFTWKLIVKELPILKITTRQAIYNRMQKLCDKDIIQPNPNNQTLGESWYRFSSNYFKLLFDPPVNETFPTCKADLSEPVKSTLHNNTTTDNTTNDKGADKSASSLRDKKIQFMKLVIDWGVEHPDKYPKLLYKQFVIYWTEQNLGGKKLKLRYEDQKFFDVGRRLATWFSKSQDADLQKMWEEEKKLPSVNEIFKQILGINGKQQ